MTKKNRNTCCSCGSGKKYKKCCMIKNHSRPNKGTRVKIEEHNYKIWDRKVFLESF